MALLLNFRLSTSLRGHGLDPVLPWARCFTLHCSSSLSFGFYECITDYRQWWIFVYERHRWVPPRSRNGAPLNRFAREESVKRFEQSWSRIVYCNRKELTAANFRIESNSGKTFEYSKFRIRIEYSSLPYFVTDYGATYMMIHFVN